jgi:thioredoxin reductase (NADPH)
VPDLFDVLVVGGGPAGLSAALYAARALRRTLVLDRGGGRWDGPQVTENYFGFPDGVPARELRARGAAQARRLGAAIEHAAATDVQEGAECFVVQTDRGPREARTIVLATGVDDRYPDVPDWRAFEGAGLYWCLTCDGPLARGRPAAVIGDDEAAACEALQLRRFTDRVTLVAPGRPRWTEARGAALARAGVPVAGGPVERIEPGPEGRLAGIRLPGGERVAAEVAFVHEPGRPNSALARRLGLALSDKGYISVNTEQRTSRPRVYAAGDVTRLHSHQVVTAVHEGATAAIAASFDLLPPECRP